MNNATHVIIPPPVCSNHRRPTSRDENVYFNQKSTLLFLPSIDDSRQRRGIFPVTGMYVRNFAPVMESDIHYRFHNAEPDESRPNPP
jgi:hypothetical protein